MAKKLWGGRFTKKIDKDFFEFQKSIHYDYKLAEFDIVHSHIHIGALLKAGILKTKEAIRLKSVLQKVEKDIEKEVQKGTFKVKESEDIHTEIQNRVERKLGKNFSSLSLKLHSLRSRNDQIVFDERFYCLKESLEIGTAIINLENSLLFLAKQYVVQKFIGYTHTQRAQIIYFVDYLLAFQNMFRRDHQRIERFKDNLHLYIGAGALTGSSLSRGDYDQAVKELSLVKEGDIFRSLENPIDNVSDRDFIVELVSILSITQMHLSRLAEDLILYSTKEFNLIDLPEEFCTGSSLMPHKKNPDFLELVRGNTGKIYGNLVSILTTMKGLPLSYNRDMQLDKEPLFSSVETIKNELNIMAKLIKGIEVNGPVIESILNQDISLYATELAEWLVRQVKEPFKKAHDIVGRFIILLEKAKGDVNKIDDETLHALHPVLNKNIIRKIMNPKHAIESKKSFRRKVLK